VVRALGLVSSLGVVAVGLFPSDEFASLHPFLMLAGGGSGIGATALGIVGLGAGPRRRLGLAIHGAAAVLVSAADLTLYVRQLFVASPAPMAIAVLERLALILFLAWQATLAWSAAP
jgi:hypothetical protein